MSALFETSRTGDDAADEGAAPVAARTVESVTIVSQLPPPVHGSTVMTAYLVESLRGADVHVDVVDRRFSRVVDDVGRYRFGKIARVPSLVRRLRRVVLRERPDRVVFFLTSRLGSFLVDVVLLEVLHRLRVPVVLYLHTTGYRDLASHGPLLRQLLQRVYRGAAEVVTLGSSLVADVAQFVPADQITIIPNSTLRGPVAPRPDDGRFRALFLSNLMPEKGVEACIRVAARLLAERPEGDWHFDIAGAGSAERIDELAAMIRDAGLDDRVTLHGAVRGEGKWRLLSEADVLVFPSTYRLEAQPLTIVEAMSVGLPVVAYDNGGIRDMVADGRSGVLVPAGDEQALAAAVLRMLGDGPGTMRDGAHEVYRTAHAPERYTAAWLRVLETPSISS